MGSLSPGRHADNHESDPDRRDSIDPQDRRRHRRVDVPLKARVLRQDGSEETCLVVNISAGGAMLKARNAPQAGEEVVLYIDDVGRFEGRVIRATRHVFAVDYRGRRAKSHRTADSLTYVMNAAGRRSDRRSSPRIKQDAPTVVSLEDGTTIACAVLDISLTGASIEIDPRPPLGAQIVVGKMSATVVRRHEQGVGVVFTGPAARMEEVIVNTTVPHGSGHGAGKSGGGAGLARSFGRKGVSS